MNQLLSIFNPKHLPARLIVFVLYCISFLSLKNKMRLGKWLGGMAKNKLKSRAHIARKNLQACFKDKTEEEIEAMVEDCFIQLTTGFIEGTHAWWQDMAPHQARVKSTGIEHLIEAQKKGNGVLLLGGHFAVVDFAIPLIAAQIDNLAYMYRPNNNPVINNMIEKGRARAGVSSFTKKQLKEMKTFMADGGVVWYGCDQDFGKKGEVFAPFFGVDAINITTPSWIVKETGAAVIFMGMRRLGEGEYEIEFSKELPEFGHCNQTDTLCWNKELEQAVRRFPTQYMWVHKRFKTRPEGEKAFY
ncbi:MAG: lipid A biosynthesis acyltransferase [Bermanella sp.]